MVVERFRSGGTEPIGERFRRCGRMLPEGVAYQASWVDAAGTRCFQLLEAPSREALNAWTRRWDDLVEFEVSPVLPSAEFWAAHAPRE